MPDVPVLFLDDLISGTTQAHVALGDGGEDEGDSASLRRPLR